jgi:hypothetical protein
MVMKVNEMFAFASSKQISSPGFRLSLIDGLRQNLTESKHPHGE